LFFAFSFFKNAELTSGQTIENVFAAVDVPKVEVPAGRSPNAPSTEATQRHSVPRAVVEITCVADCVGIVPTEANGAFPGVWRDVWSRCAIVHDLILVARAIGQIPAEL
jgi:hypothetical protein